MADVKDILGVPRAGPSQPDEKAPAPKEKKEKIKRPEGMSREAFALLGGSHPIISSQLASSLKKNDMLKKPKPSTKGIITYQYRPFRNAARTDGLELFHWLKCSKGANGVIREPDDSEYPYAKYNKKVQLYKYNDEEYDSLIRPESGNWTREETDYLYDLCEQFDLRWHVVFDRYEWRWRPSTGGIPGQPPPPRSVEDLKERYYNVARKLLVSRQGREAAVANNTIVKHPFNKQVEQDRKRALAALLARTPQQISEEHAILAEARAIEEKRKAEAMAARRAAAAAAAATTTTTTTATAAAAAAAPRTTSPSQPGRPVAPAAAVSSGAATAAPIGGAPMGLGAVAGGAPRALSPMPGQMSGDMRHPADFEPAPPPGIPSLFDVEVKPFKPKPGVYLRGAHTQAMAAQQAAAMTGGSRAFKAVEATLTELQCPAALYGPRVMTRSTSGAWLALRSEVIALHETRRNLANRLNADTDRAVRRPEKRRRP
ncbi:hypothetical protein Vretimale_3151 [Volvox reticuliferus]|uniref:Myb-like domain-containing protein n=1 Tax=Volvox reticuliferus TaxID=1737510 RepID=A0A8J4FI17_9CHLO|nr:hypothetical protein Vretifemale_6593 [Volvox reticuliferus]GIL97486.1 hypothetical protein Vretimale_3151 [Volvox reticuliferus]